MMKSFNQNLSFLIGSILVILSGCLLNPYATLALTSGTVTPVYEYRTLHNPDGIGKFYLGREIAQVMGHEGARWLERPSRETSEHPQQALSLIHI